MRKSEDFKLSQYADVEFEGLNPKKPLYFSPYFLASYQQVNELKADETRY